MGGVPEYAAPEQQQQSRGCGRTFNLKAFARHAKICKKVFEEKRKEFDSQSARLAGTGANPGARAGPTGTFAGSRRGAGARAREPVRPGGGPSSSSSSSASASASASASSSAKSAKWKARSEQFRAAMRAARDPGAAPAPAGPDPSLVPCPHCGRRFNEKAAERHIPKCQTIKAQPKMLRRGQGRAGGVGGRASAAGGSRRAPGEGVW